MRRLLLVLAFGLSQIAGPVFAQSTTPEPTETTSAETESGGMEPLLTVDLNKLEPVEGACRAYLVVENGPKQEFTTFVLDLYVFDPDGTISKRLAVDIAPLIPGKTRVRLVDIRDTACSDVSKVLLNDVLDCADKTGQRDDCVLLVSLTSLSGTEFML